MQANQDTACLLSFLKMVCFPCFIRRQDDKGPVVVLEGGGSYMFYGL